MGVKTVILAPGESWSTSHVISSLMLESQTTPVPRQVLPENYRSARIKFRLRAGAPNKNKNENKMDIVREYQAPYPLTPPTQ